MIKKKILIVAHHLTIGGIQKSLISALDIIDYTKNDVTLYIRKKRVDLIPYINKNVRIIINDDKKHYYRQPKMVYYQLLIAIYKLFNSKKIEENQKKMSQYLAKKMFEQERNKYFKGENFDIAISYWQGYNTLFVDEYVNAKKKIMFYQGSVDELHEIHQEVMPRYDRIVVEHEDIGRLLCSWYNNIEEKIVIIQNYINVDLIKKMSTEESLKRVDGKIILCTCARFSKDKGIDLAIEAAKILKEKDISFMWYMVGSGPLYESIESLIYKYELSGTVILTGMKKNPYTFMSMSDIYIQPSYEEALSIAMLESQILCKPMVSTKTSGGLAMVIDGVNGYLSDINAEALADTIEKAIINKKETLKMKEYLSSIDYSNEKRRYMDDWRKLLED